MLKLIEGSYASQFPREMDAMFRNRAQIFGERLGWEVVVKDGYERDRFDDLNPLYLVSVDPDTEAYQGSVRLLPTSGPNMLRDVFPQRRVAPPHPSARPARRLASRRARSPRRDRLRPALRPAPVGGRPSRP
jgi:N-acyl-L-homoserine lactone synthetase